MKNICITILFVVCYCMWCSCSNPSEPSDSTRVTIDAAIVHQIIRGFGAANIVPWRPDMTTDQINIAFGTGVDQIGFTILRLRVPSLQSEFNLNVPTAQLAQSMGVTIIASPWSPPASMKTNNNIIGGELKESSYADYATHLKSFADFMSDNGVPLYAISIQNEPDVNVTYESCDWNASQMLKFTKDNAAAIGTKIILPESGNFNKTISNAILNDPVAAANIAIIGGHLYRGGLESYPLAESKGKELWMTEYLDLDTLWEHNLATGKQINDVMKTGMSAYIWWYIVRFYGPIRENGSVSKRGYVMSQFARFIRPGFYRVESSIAPSNIDITAYKDPSSSKVVIVAVNSGSNQAETVFRIQNGGSITTFTPYTTTETKNCEQGNEFYTTGDNFTFTLEPSSITTFVSN
jgi:glucuronoarabinoxylan endo-1,4-beta-xylanase